MATNTSAYTLAAEDGPWSQLRTATVSSATANQAVIVAAGSSFSASFLEPYQPAAGDLVAVLRQDASWVILGRIAGSGSNVVCNPSFEDSASGTFPTTWTAYDITGESAWSVAANAFAPDGDNVVSVSGDGGAATQAYLYSCAIPVAPGQVYQVSVYVGGSYDIDVPQTADAALFALWFAQDTDLYPTTSAADTSIATLNDVPGAPPFSTLSGQVTVPAATSYMRVALRSTLGPDQSLLWDFSLARRTA